MRCSIPYVRFDGQLSARRRQEALEQFSIPLEPGDNLVVDVENPLPQRRSRTSTQASLEEENDLEDNDPTFIVGDADDDDNDYDFEEDISARAKKGRKKSKTKNKGKGKARLDSSLEGKIPRVMLISLKAGALGLNLTVANNVFL